MTRGPARTARLSVLARLQLGLEALYRVETHLAIDAFVIDEGARAAAGVERAPREQLLVQQDDGELGLGLFVDAATVANLERHDPTAVGIDERNFSDFCLAVEGVSHFIYLALRAADDRGVSQLELELQAEVDKFACCLLVSGPTPGLRWRLYGDVRFADDLNHEERARYRAANSGANRYADTLERRFVQPERTDALLTELRQFYRMDLPDKLGHIARLD